MNENRQINPKTLLFGNLIKAYDFESESWLFCRVIGISGGRISLEGIEGAINGHRWQLTYEQIQNTDHYKKIGS